MGTPANFTGGYDSRGRLVRPSAKLTFLVGAIVLTTTATGWAQVESNRVLQTPVSKPEPVKPGEQPPLFTVNDNTVGYRYLKADSGQSGA
jgi:hypothetical protein